MSGQAAGRHHSDYPKHPRQDEHAGVAQHAVEHRDLGDGDDRCHVGQALGEQEPEVGLVVDRTEGVTHGRGHDGVNAREHGVQGSHHGAVPDLGSQGLVT